MIKKFFNRLFGIKKLIPIQGFVYLDTDDKPVCYITDRIRWLEKLSIKTFSEEDAEKEAFSILNSKHPDLKGLIWLF